MFFNNCNFNLKDYAAAWVKTLIVLCTLSTCHGKTFRIAWIAPEQSSGLEINSFTSVAGLKLALSSIMANPMILKGHNIEVQYISTDCTPQNSIQATMKAKTSFNPDVIIGPPCPQGMRLVAQLCAFWNLPVFTWYNTGVEFESVKSFPTMIRVIPSLGTMAKALLHIVRQNSWSELAFIYEDSEPWTLYEEAVRLELAHTEVNMLSSHDVNSSLTDWEIVKMFRHIKKYAWVVVFACPFGDIQRYMMLADQAGMTDGNYVFIQLDHQMHPEKVINKEILSDRRWKRGYPNDQTARKAFKNLIHIMIDSMNDDGNPNLMLPRNRYYEFQKMAEAELNKQTPGWTLPAGGKPDVYSLYLYDAVLVWSVLADKLQAAGKNHADGKLMALEAETFIADGASGYIAFNGNLDRTGKVFILSMQQDGRFRPAQILKFNATNGYEVVNIKPLHQQVRKHGGQTGHKIHPPPMTTVPLYTPPVVVTYPTTLLPTAHNTKPTPDLPHAQSSNPLIRMLLERVQSLESAIKQHEQHAHHNIPGPAVGTGLNPQGSPAPKPNVNNVPNYPQSFSNVGPAQAAPVHNQTDSAYTPQQFYFDHGHWHVYPQPGFPPPHQQQTAHQHHVTHEHNQESSQQVVQRNRTMNIQQQIRTQHVPQKVALTQGHHTLIPPPPVHSPANPTPTMRITTTTTTTTTTAPTKTATTTKNGNGGNGNFDETMINRISARILDHLTGVETNGNQSNSHENQIVNDWISNGIEEMPLALVLGIRAERQRRFLAQQLRQAQNNRNNNQNNQNSNNNAQNQGTSAPPAWQDPYYQDPLGAALGFYDSYYTPVPAYLGFLLK